MAIKWEEQGPNRFVAKLPAPVSVFKAPGKKGDIAKPWRISIFGACQHDLGWFADAKKAMAAAEKQLRATVATIAKRLGGSADEDDE